jgi:hypothetical protein
MNFLNRLEWHMAAIALLILMVAGAEAQVTNINSAVITTRVDNGVPGALVTAINLYPSIVLFNESKVSAPTGSDNKDVWQFSSNGGVSAYQFQDFDFFNASNIVQLTGSPANPSKQAGFVFNTASAGSIVFSVDTLSHAVVATGSSFGSYSFSTLSYNSGDTIALGFDYLKAPDGGSALQFFANGIASPVFEFSPGQDIGNGSTFGGFFQIQNDPANPNNSGLVTFQNIGIVSTPEPSSVAILGVGLMALLAVSKLRRSY